MSDYNKKNVLCRTCLDSICQDNIINIFETMDLAEKLKLCSGQSVEAGDEYPVNVCQHCYEQILLFYDFHQMCCKSLIKFKNSIKVRETQLEKTVRICFQIKSLPKDPWTANSDKLKEKSNESSDNRDILMAKKIPAELYKLKSDDEKLERRTVIKNTPRNNDFIAKRALRSEKAADYKNLENGIGKKKNKGTSTEQVCKDLETHPTPMTDLCNSNEMKSKHGIEHQNPKYSDDDFTSSQQLKKYQCNRCSKHFSAPDRLEAHVRQHEDLPPYTCTLEDCERTFNRVHFYIKHQKEHSLLREQIFKCDLDNCERVYKNKSALNIHKRKFHNSGPELKTHMCEICAKVFKSSAVLNDHHYTHIDKTQLPYACEEDGCVKRFSNKEKLKIHKMRHAGIKNFICPHCGMRKTTRNELKIHINYHTLERTWPCRFCPKVCNSAGNLKMHVKNIHERAKDFACRFCERTFAKADTRKYHEMIHTGEKPNECKECGRRFVQPAALRTHRKIHLREKGKVGENRKCKAVVEAKEKQHILQDVEPEVLQKRSVVAEILCDTNKTLD